MLKTQLVKIVANASLGFVMSGYSTGYMNPALNTIDSVFAIVEDKEYYNGLIASVYCLCAGTGVFLIPIALSVLSRRETMILLDLVGIIGCLFEIIGFWETFILGRILVGLNVGMNLAVVPIYVKEFSPSEATNLTGSIMTCLGSFGLFLAFLLGTQYNQYPTANDQFWRVGFTFPIVFFMIRSFNLLKYYKHDSAEYYLSKDDPVRALESLCYIFEENMAEERLHLQQIQAKYKINIWERNHPLSEESYASLFQGESLRNLMRGLMLAIIMQFMGINAVIFYSSQLFNQITNGDYAVSNLLNLIIPILGCTGAMIMGLILNKITRKQLVQLGMVSSIITLAYLGWETSQTQSSQIFIILALFAYILLFSVTLGPGFWVLSNSLPQVIIPEILNAKGVTICVSATWLATAIVGQIFPALLAFTSISFCFYAFAVFGVIGYIYVALDFDLQLSRRSQLVIDTSKDVELRYLENKLLACSPSTQA